MWAELLYNRSFEEGDATLGDYAGGGLVDKVDTKKAAWWHSGYEAAKWYLHKDAADTASRMEIFAGTWPFPGHGKQCVKVFNQSNNTDILFCQDSIYLRRGIAYRFEGLLNNLQEFTADSVTKRSVVISICLFKEKDFSKPLSEQVIAVNTGYFRNYQAVLPAFDYQGRGTFAIKVHAGSKLNMDLLSLMPADNVLGWRKDVVEVMKDSVPVGTIRFPGGCFASTYLWKDGIGDRQKRKMIFGALSDGGGDVLQDVGTVEFLNLCKLTGAKPILDVAVMLNTAENAAGWVSFCNAPKDPLRSSVGYDKPFNVRYWEMDNEPYRKFDAFAYAHKCVEFSKAMKKVDPGIKIIMAAYFIYGPKLKEMLDIAGPYIDVVNKREDLPFGAYQKTLNIIRAYNKTHGTHITMCDTETTFPLEVRKDKGVDGLNHQIADSDEPSLNKTVRWAHGMSGIKNYIKFQNLGGDFLFANYWAYINSYGENLINVTKENVFVSAPGKAFRFLQLAKLSLPVKVEKDGSAGNTLVQAGWSAEKDKFVVIVLNFDDKDIVEHFDFSKLNVKNMRCSMSYCAYAATMEDYNSPGHPNRVLTESSRPGLEGLQVPLTARGNAATYWVFDVMR
jgi:alpha-N-arabinofuranosidase